MKIEKMTVINSSKMILLVRREKEENLRRKWKEIEDGK